MLIHDASAAPMIADTNGHLLRKIGWSSAAMVVVANMVGTGIFTTTGFMARDLGSAWVILATWIVGGIIALCGALAYAELGAALPEAGGEYVYLREAYGPLVGFLSGWTSFFVGFSGAIAAALLGFAGYLDRLAPALTAAGGDARVVVLAALWILTAAHCLGVGPSSRLQATLAACTIGAIVVMVAAGFSIGHGSFSNLRSAAPSHGSVAVSLIFVLYAYSGWNAAAYLAGEIRDPSRGVPRALLIGTAAVAALYFALNATYLYALPVAKLAGVLSVGETTADALFGRGAARLVAAIIALAILSSASAMVLAGPRVYYAMARDRMAPHLLATTGARSGAPATAIIVQSVWTSVLILFFHTFEAVVVYTGFAVTLFSAAAVGAVIVLRTMRPAMPRPFLMPGYPWLALIFLAISGWIAIYTVAGRPREALIGLATVFAGAPVYLLMRFLAGRATRPMNRSRTSTFVVLVFLLFTSPAVSRAEASLFEVRWPHEDSSAVQNRGARGPGNWSAAPPVIRSRVELPTRWIPSA
jgi:APA family basic amino acid/polyamine antiporter